MTIRNLTPHDVRILNLDGSTARVYEADGNVARLGTVDLGTQAPAVGMDMTYELVEFHHLENPPPREDGTWYIVSLPTALASPRADFLVPYVEVRDDNGRIMGCRFLARPV